MATQRPDTGERWRVTPGDSEESVVVEVQENLYRDRFVCEIVDIDGGGLPSYTEGSEVSFRLDAFDDPLD